MRKKRDLLSNWPKAEEINSFVSYPTTVFAKIYETSSTLPGKRMSLRKCLARKAANYQWMKRVTRLNWLLRR